MSTDFSEIIAAMSQVPDVDIDPESGTTMRASGKTLGQKYQMEDKVSPQAAEKIRERALLNEDGKKASKSTVNAYREMIGLPTTTQVKAQQTQDIDGTCITEEEHLQNFMENKDVVQPVQSQPVITEAQYSQVNDDMMDMYVNSINKKNKWRK